MQNAAAVHFYPNQAQRPAHSRKSHPVKGDTHSLEKGRGTSSSFKGDRFIPLRGTDPFRYEHALLRADIQVQKKSKEPEANQNAS